MADAAPVRIGLLWDGAPLPRWVGRAVDRLRASPLANVSALIRATHLLVRPAPRRGVVAPFRLFDALDVRRSGAGELSQLDWDPRELPPEVKRVELAGDTRPAGALELDLLLSLQPGSDGTRARDALGIEVWSMYLGSSEPPALLEVLTARPTLESGVRSVRPGAGGAVTIYRAHGAVDRRSRRLTLDLAARRMGELLVRCLRDRGRGVTTVEPPAPARAALGPLSTPLALARWGAWATGRMARGRLFRRQWQLLVRFGGSPLDRTGTQVLRPPSDRFWADPFPVRHDGRHFLFFEELLFRAERGRIACCEVRRDGTITPPETVLERDYHLSYPFLFEWQNALYMLPETSQNRTIELYRCHEFPGDWRLEGILMREIEAVDPTLLHHGARWWLLANVAVEGGSTSDELYVFFADTPLGPWTPHPANPVRSDVRSARPAGRPFLHDGAWLRPAQCCAPHYGASLSLRRIERLDPERYLETECGSLLPARGELGLHTLNHAGELVVFDRLVWIPRWS